MIPDNDNNHEKNEDSSADSWMSKLFVFCFDWLEMLSQATVFMVVIISFAFKTVNVSGASMLNTLFDGDRLIIRKWYYTPRDGDIVVASRGQNLDMPIIKRVIATEGQTLKIDYSSGTVTVDGKILDELYIKEPMIQKGDIEVPVVIPKGYAFVMGDNRNSSWDSRFAAVGLIKNENIVGKAVFRIYPFDKMGNLS